MQQQQHLQNANELRDIQGQGAMPAGSGPARTQQVDPRRHSLFSAQFVSGAAPAPWRTYVDLAASSMWLPPASSVRARGQQQQFGHLAVPCQLLESSPNSAADHYNYTHVNIDNNSQRKQQQHLGVYPAPTTQANRLGSSLSEASTKAPSSSSVTSSPKASPISVAERAKAGPAPTDTGAASAAKPEQEQEQQKKGEKSDSDEEKLRAYLSQFVLASNVPFAYAIILIAFLITMIAATSIITILTIVLTFTGSTAYPLTENTFTTSLIVGVVCASFALALVTLSLIVWRRHCQAAYYYLDEPQDASRATNSPQLSETYDDSEYGSILVQDWAKHVQLLHADSDIGFSREFEQIQQANQKNSTALTCDHSQLPENKHKNRYINIVAYDHTRVVLRSPMGGQKKQGYDYINANFIDGYNKPRAYIGTQGPLVSTFDDYWRMIWEQRVVIIVMITNLQERGRRKCDMYWPKEGSETYGYVQVKLLQEVVMATYTLRTFTVKNLKLKKKLGPERTVYQYHYTNWPDHGVPDHPLPVLSFVRKSAAANPPGAGAIICHCSAGCGRSGTYIVIDAMLKQIRHRQSINVVDFLKHIRAQRNYLVQTEEQYIFIHDALVEAIESGETEIPSNFIAKYIQLLQTGGSGGANGAISTKQSNYSLANGLQTAPALASVNQSESQSNLLVAATNNNGSSQATTVSRSQSSQWSLLERQYRLVASFKAKDFCVVSALKPCNKAKNRTLNLIPLEAHRVHITPKPGADGSDYINATFLMGFNHLHEFIVTQHPVQETFSDFWQMVYDHNSQTVVLLSQMGEQLLKEFPQFWPQKEDEVDYGSFKVKLTQESVLVQGEGTTGPAIVARDFIMRSNQDDYELQTRIIHCPGWPECCGPPVSNVFELIRVVQQATHQQANRQRAHDGAQQSQTVTIGQEHEPQNGGPIIVVDKFGGTEAATFAVLTTLFKQINFEDAVDVYMYAKLAHLRRPGIWGSQDDYLFLYRAMENYASELLAAQQQQQAQGHQLDAKQQQAIIGTPLAGLHHPASQTMTLDRHSRHKASSASLKHQTSTMRRPNASAAASVVQKRAVQQPLYQNVQQAQQHLGRSKSPTLNSTQAVQRPTDLNHNNPHYAPGTLPPAYQQQQQQQQQQQLQHQHQLQQQHPNNLAMQQQQMSKGSPYNSATSIGVGSHQHLLAATKHHGHNGGPQQVVAAAALRHQNSSSTQNTSDFYLYSMQ